jgi:predicted ATP-grasp superfamily ATP-dependent carboligase
MTRTVLLTLGRLPKALDLARGFKALGWRVIVAEPFRWHLTRTSRAVAKSYQVTAPAEDSAKYLSDLLRIITQEGVTLVVPVSEEILHASFLRASLPPYVRLFAMPSSVLLGLHNKRTFVDACQSYGVSAPTTKLLGEAGDHAMAEQTDFIVKPVFSCSGRGVVFCLRGAALPAPSTNEPLIVQAWVKGQVLSTFTLAHKGSVRTTVVYRGAVMSGSVAVCFERVLPSDPHHAPVAQWVQQFVQASGFSGFISFDLVVDAQGQAHGIECNPRATSGLHFVNARDLATAVADPASTAPIAFRNQHLMQQFYPCLTEVQKSMLGSGPFQQNLRRFLQARDVTWSVSDPLPFLTMPLTASQIIWLSMRAGTTFGEVATLDVGWYSASDAAWQKQTAEPLTLRNP